MPRNEGENVMGTTSKNQTISAAHLDYKTTEEIKGEAPIPDAAALSNWKIRASIGGSLYYAQPQADSTIQLSTSETVWTLTPVDSRNPTAGCRLSIGQQYLSSATKYIEYKNYCLTVVSDISSSAVVVPILEGSTYVLALLGTDKYLTLDTRGYVTQFETFAPLNDYPYFQHLALPAG